MKSNHLSILYVENDKHDYKLVKRALQNDGLIDDLTWAQSGEEALQMLETTDFDIILLDYLLIGLNGLEILQKLKAIQCLP